MDPFREICMRGDNHGNKKGVTKTWNIIKVIFQVYLIIIIIIIVGLFS